MKLACLVEESQGRPTERPREAAATLGIDFLSEMSGFSVYDKFHENTLQGIQNRCATEELNSGKSSAMPISSSKRHFITDGCVVCGPERYCERASPTISFGTLCSPVTPRNFQCLVERRGGHAEQQKIQRLVTFSIAATLPLPHVFPRVYFRVSCPENALEC